MRGSVRGNQPNARRGAEMGLLAVIILAAIGLLAHGSSGSSVTHEAEGERPVGGLHAGHGHTTGWRAGAAAVAAGAHSSHGHAHGRSVSRSTARGGVATDSGVAGQRLHGKGKPHEAKVADASASPSPAKRVSAASLLQPEALEGVVPPAAPSSPPPQPSPSASSSAPAPAPANGPAPVDMSPLKPSELLDYGHASELVRSPTVEERAWSARVLVAEESSPRAWDGTAWNGARELSVAHQFAVRNALDVETNFHVSRLAVRTEADMKPCKRIVVSVATIPSRIGRLYNLINSLRRQDLPPDQVLVALPPFATRLKQRYDVPDFIRDDPFVKLVSMPADYGPLSKLAAGILSERDPETCIITIDDDSEAREFTLAIIATWGAIYPTAVVAAQGWNVTCIIGHIPYVCPGQSDHPYLFVRNDYDHMCQLESLPLYNFHHCLSAVNKTSPRSADVAMGAATPLYRRGMFGNDFLDLAKVTAGNKIRQMLHAHYKAVGAPRTDEELRSKPPGPAGRPVEAGGAAAGAAAAAAAPAAPHGEHHTGHGHPVGGDVLDADILALAHKALENPALAEETDGMRVWREAEPPEALFLVDDIYISAYLNRKGVPRVIVPWGDPNQAVAPVPYLKPADAAPMPSQPPRSPDEPSLTKVEPNVGAIDALHGVAGFDAGNVAAVRFFEKAGWWDKPRWPL